MGPEKILLILLIALIVLGPHELPNAARKLGNVMRELRRLSAGFEHELRSAFDDVTSSKPPDNARTREGEPQREPDEADPAA